MNPGYLRIRAPLQHAMARYAAWIGRPEVDPPREVGEDEAIDLALDGDDWRGLAVYVFPAGDWTVFYEISGGLGARPVEDWVRLAGGGDLVYAGYNDAIGYAELVKVEAGRLVRHFMQDEQEPGDDVNTGRLPGEEDEPMDQWPDVAMWVDEDEETFLDRDRGWLLIHAGER